MTEKRFEWDNINIAITDTQNRKKYWIDVTCIDEIVDLLNELSEKNEQLKKDCTVLIYHNQDYRKENEQLKKDCSNLIDDNTEYVAEINQMHKENEQLKVDKQALIDFIKKEFPKSHKHILEGFE